jgi:hypothetical protein
VELHQLLKKKMELKFSHLLPKTNSKWRIEKHFSAMCILGFAHVLSTDHTNNNDVNNKVWKTTIAHQYILVLAISFP